MYLKDKLKNFPSLLHIARVLLAYKRGIWGLVNSKHAAKEYLKSTWSFATKSSNVLGKPIIVTIEPTTICNLRCPVCESGSGDLRRPRKHMQLESFKSIIDKIASHCNTLIFYFMGEPFANPFAYEMIRYAKKKGVAFITTCTNGDLVNPEKLISSGIDEVSFQIGGMTKETHAKYRINSNLDRVLRNLEHTVELKRKYNSYTRIVCGLILMRHNEHEINDFKKKMKEIGVDDAVIIDPCVRTIEQASTILPSDIRHWLYDPISYKMGVLKPKIVPMNECPWLYYSMTIQVDGSVVPCCRDSHGEYVMGNILKQDFMEVWNGEDFVNFRKKINKSQFNISLCKLCSGFGLGVIR